MSRRVYTPEMLDFLRAGYARMECCDLTDAFNARFGMSKTQGQIKACLGNHGITARRKGPMKGKRLSFTPDQISWLKDAYRKMPQADLPAAFSAQFGVKKSERQIRAFLKNYSIRSGRMGRFEPGTSPWNKGMKGWCPDGCQATQFRPGNMPANVRPMHAERVGKNGYIEIKVPERNPYTGAPTRFRHKHVWLWEQAHGRRLPDGHVVIFLDGNNRNFDIENLRLISRAELLYLNRRGLNLAELPADARESALALARLETTTHQIMRERKA